MESHLDAEFYDRFYRPEALTPAQRADFARTTGQTVTVPTALDTPNTVLILGETSLPYQSPIQFLPLGVWNLHAATYMFPRASSTINLTP